MDVPPSILFGGIAVGFGACGVALRLIYTTLAASLSERINALEKALSSAQREIHELRQFERDTIMGLLVESNGCIQDCHKANRKANRLIEILRHKYGDSILVAIEDAKKQAEAEQAQTDTITRKNRDHG